MVKKSAGTEFLKTAIKASKNEFASIAADGIIYDNKGYISTGNYLLNLQMGGDMFEGGLPSNTATCFAGLEGVGKTFLVLGLIKTFLDKHPDGVVTLFESEGAVKREMLRLRGIDVTRCAVHPIGTIEEFRFECMQLIETYAAIPDKEKFPYMICLDSLGMLSDKKETEDAMKGEDKADMGGHARRIKATFRVLRQKFAKYNIPLVLTNHLFSDPGAYIPTLKVSGGSGIKYAADNIFILNKKKLKEGEEGFENGGIAVLCKAEKARETKPFTEIPFTINFEKGLTPFSGLFDFCLEMGVIEREGTKYRILVGEKESVSFTKKEAYLRPESIFTPEVLKKINERLKPYFVFGSAVEKVRAKEEEAEEGEENEDVTNG